jgi:predicted nuclease with TOPRIM domain
MGGLERMAKRVSDPNVLRKVLLIQLAEEVERLWETVYQLKQRIEELEEKENEQNKACFYMR